MSCWCHAAAVVVDRPFSWWLQAHALPGQWGEPGVMMDMTTAALIVWRAAAMPACKERAGRSSTLVSDTKVHSTVYIPIDGRYTEDP